MKIIVLAPFNILLISGEKVFKQIMKKRLLNLQIVRTFSKQFIVLIVFK